MTTEQTQDQPETRPSEVRSDALLDFLGLLFLANPENGEDLTMSQVPEDLGSGIYRLHVHNKDCTRHWMHTITTEEV